MKSFQVKKDRTGAFMWRTFEVPLLEEQTARKASEMMERDFPDNAGHAVTVTIEIKALIPDGKLPEDVALTASAVLLEDLRSHSNPASDARAFAKKRIQHFHRHGFQTVGDVLKVLRERDDVRGRWITTDDLIRIQDALKTGHGLDIDIFICLKPKED